MAHADPLVHAEIAEIGIQVFKDGTLLPKFFLLSRSRLRIRSRGHGKPYVTHGYWKRLC